MRHPAPVRTAAALALGVGVPALAYRALLSPTGQFCGAFPSGAEVDRPVVALSFDDGPNEPFTSRIADTLAGYGVPATFFCVGSCVRRHPGVARRLVRDGHAVGNHSDHHLARRYLTQPSFRRELVEAQRTLTDETGVTPTLFRPPWLFRQPLLLTTVRDLGLHAVSGRFAHPLEPWQPAPGRLVAGAIRAATPGTFVILHDGREGRGGDRSATAAAVGPLVRRLLDEGVGFARIDDLLGISRPD